MLIIWDSNVLVVDDHDIRSLLLDHPTIFGKYIGRSLNKAPDWPVAKGALKEMCHLNWISWPSSSLSWILVVDKPLVWASMALVFW